MGTCACDRMPLLKGSACTEAFWLFYYEVMPFWYVQLSVFWKCIQYSIHWDKTNVKKIFFRQINTVLYLALFWSQYTALGSQTQPQTLRSAKNNSSRNRQMTIQSHESNVLSYSECRIAKVFWGFSSGPHWGRLIALHRHLGTKNSLFLLLQAPAHHSFIFNL